MRGWMAAMMAMMAMAAGAAQAQPPVLSDASFCAQLRRIVAAADDDEPFRALEIARPNPPTLGFRHGCVRSGGKRQYFWLCTQNLAPPELGRERLAAATRACLPEARPIALAYPQSIRSIHFRLPRATIRISDSGGPGAHVGLSVTYVVAAEPRR